MKTLRSFIPLCFLFLSLAGLSGCVSTPSTQHSLREALTLYASFDDGADADYAAGDKQLFGAATRAKIATAPPGLPEGDAIQWVKGEGRNGHALRYTKKSDAIVFFKGAKNFDYQSNNWSASISFWLKLDPDKDLQPGYCDPLQIAAGNWTNGVFFAEFSKDETPRFFRCALRPLFPIWNPKSVGWEAIPAKDRPMVQVSNPPFGRDRWTHVLFTFRNANTHRKDGSGRLFLNGEPAGEFRDWELTLNWKPEQIQVSIGASYVGLFDELALFNRALDDNEVKTIYRQKNGLRSLISSK
jgi:hypothetical protein